MVVILVATIFSLALGGKTEFSRSIFNAISKPFQSSTTNIVNRLKESVDIIFNAKDYYEENVKLRDELNKANKDLIDYDKISKENSELRELLNLSLEAEDLVFSSPATIIARISNDPFGSFVINKGSNDGISPYDTVMTSEAIVGVCVEVSANTSKVQTLYSPKSAVGVISVREKVQGVLEGSYTASKENVCYMNYIDRDDDIKVGDIIYSAGSEIFPEGQLIGTVKSVTMENSGLSKYAEIELSVEPNNITTVFVVTSFSGQGESDEY